MDLVATVLDGILLGGLYALFASGLSLIFGVMRLVNIAHGDLIVLSAFIALIVTARLGVHPLVSLVLVVPLMALLGYGLQRGIFNRTLGSDILRPVLCLVRSNRSSAKRLTPDLQRGQPATAGR
jgi:branched-chain amino acid transport system permease protein